MVRSLTSSQLLATLLVEVAGRLPLGRVRGSTQQKLAVLGGACGQPRGSGGQRCPCRDLHGLLASTAPLGKLFYTSNSQLEGSLTLQTFFYVCFYGF